MRVLIDTQSVSGQKSGFGSYLSNLMEVMARVAPDIEYVGVRPASSSRDLSTPRRLLWDQGGFARATWRGDIDLVHQPAFSAPIAHRHPLVVTAHDLITLRFPEHLSLASRTFFGKVMPFSYRFADRILTVSEASKRDLISLIGVPEEKITVTPLAAGSAYRPVRDKEKIAAVKAKYGIDGPYFLDVCTLEPRKNHAFLIQAYAAARSRFGLSEKLVLVGKKGWWYESVFKAVADLGLEKEVIFTGYTELDELPALHSGATAFLFPSKFEGFGLPPLEAMACGAPVVVADNSSLPEVAEGAGILLKADDHKGWVEAMGRLAADAGLRKEMSAKSLAKAATFSWDTTAELTAAAYRSLAK